MKRMKKYQAGSEVKGSKGSKASQIIASISAAGTAAAGVGKNIANRIKAKRSTKAAQIREDNRRKVENENRTSTLNELESMGSTMKKGGVKKPLRKAQDGKVVRTRDENVSATAYPTINPTSNAQRKSNVNRESDYPGEYTERYSSGPTTTKKGPFGRTVQKTTSTDTTVPSSGKAYGTKTTEKDVFNKKGQLIKSVSKERDINTGKLEKVNRANYKTWTGQKGGVKMKTGGMVNANTKVKAIKVAGSKGVKSGVNPKASASKRATGRSGGTSVAPKTAVPKKK